MEIDPFKSEVDSLEGKQAGMQCDCTQGFPGNNRAAGKRAASSGCMHLQLHLDQAM